MKTSTNILEIKKWNYGDYSRGSKKSAKAEKAAAEKIPTYEKMMVDYIVNKYGYILEG